VQALDRPPQTTTLRELAVVAPEYSGALALPNQALELTALRQFQGYRAVAPTLSSIAQLFANFPEGIIHFSGHGDVRQAGGRSPQYVVRMQDGDLDTSTWEGMTSARTDHHPLVFLNACETGQAQRIANFVDGWAPKVLEAGAGGYVGAMWSVGDKGAADFASRFYDALHEGLKSGPVNVAEIIRQGRSEFSATGNPTFLAYVYYGDPAFSFVPVK
jgi:CHAT domain-containing protein